MGWIRKQTSPVNTESENEPNRPIEIQIDGDREVRSLVPNRTPIDSIYLKIKIIFWFIGKKVLLTRDNLIKKGTGRMFCGHTSFVSTHLWKYKVVIHKRVLLKML
jgi:hypothetical protein